MFRASVALALASAVFVPACASGTSHPVANTPPSKSEERSTTTPPAISDECDATKIVSLSKALTAASVPERPELVAKQLPEACKLPEAVTALLTATERTDEAAPIVLYAHQWLLAQGLTQEQAKPISQALLLVARHRVAKPGQELPTLAHEDATKGPAGANSGEAVGLGEHHVVGGTGSERGGRSWGEGTIGLGNVGEIANGSETGHGFGGTGKRVPRVRQAKAEAKFDGELDKDIIRRIVRFHINEVRNCYSQGLVRDPKLAGRVTVDFTISAIGKVDRAEIDENTLGDKSVGECIAKTVKRWNFPKPTDGADVHVVYPFVLAPG